MMEPLARYREFEPCPPLRDHVRCFFTFAVPAEADQPRRPIRRELVYRAPSSYTTPLFADSQISLSFSFGVGYRIDGLWSDAKHCGHVIGAMSESHPAAHGDRIIEVGAYFRPVQARRFFGTPANELTDRILPLADLWGSSGSALEGAIGAASSDDQRVQRLEAALVARLALDGDSRSAVDLPGLAAWVQKERGAIQVADLAGSAGISRQHLGRIFREEVGMSPKLFCRLARFRAALACAGRGVDDAAGLAAELGYVDQSHMIAEFREFSGLTPKPLISRERVHPFVETL